MQIGFQILQPLVNIFPLRPGERNPFEETKSGVMGESRPGSVAGDLFLGIGLQCNPGEHLAGIQFGVKELESCAGWGFGSELRGQRDAMTSAYDSTAS
jgi:hypothetical protein